MPESVTLLVYALAVARATGLVTADEVTAELRAWVLNRILPPLRSREVTSLQPKWRLKLAYLVTCPWCVSITLGLVGAVVWYTVGDNPVLLVGAVALAFSQVTGMLSSVGRG